MATQKENLTSQVDGVTDVFFTTVSYTPGSLMLGYNGQMYPVGVNIIEEVSANTFRLSFTPEVDCTDALHVIYEDTTSSGAEPTMRASGMPPGSCG